VFFSVSSVRRANAAESIINRIVRPVAPRPRNLPLWNLNPLLTQLQLQLERQLHLHLRLHLHLQAKPKVALQVHRQLISSFHKGNNCQTVASCNLNALFCVPARGVFEIAEGRRSPSCGVASMRHNYSQRRPD